MNLTEGQVEALTLAYLERKKFEARVLWAALGEAMSGKKKDEGKMSLGQLAQAGFAIRGGK